MTYGNEWDFSRHQQQAKHAADITDEVHQATWLGLQEAIDSAFGDTSLRRLPTHWVFAWDGKISGGWVVGWPIDGNYFLTWNGCLLTRHSIAGWLQFPSLPRAKIEEYVAIRPGTNKGEWLSTVDPWTIRRHWQVSTRDPRLAGESIGRELLKRLDSIGRRPAPGLPSPPAAPLHGQTKSWGPLQAAKDFFTNGAAQGVSWLLLGVGAIVGLGIGAYIAMAAAGTSGSSATAQTVLSSTVGALVGIMAVLLVGIATRPSPALKPWLERGTYLVRWVGTDYCVPCGEPWGQNNYCRRRNHSPGKNKVTRYHPVSTKLWTSGWLFRRGPIRGPRLVGLHVPPGENLGIPYLTSAPLQEDLAKA